MGMNKSLIAMSALAGGLVAIAAPTAVVAGHNNPVDRVSNPQALDYSDVDVNRRELREPFVRDGVVTDPARFAVIEAGLTATEVRSVLGEPLQGSRSSEWDYNFQFKMPQSENYLVCQYKVVFDADQLVTDGVWRRRQCQQIAEGQAR